MAVTASATDSSFESHERDTDFVYDDEPFSWSPVPVLGTPPSPRHAHSACIFQGNMYIMGGYSTDGTKGVYLGDMHKFHFAKRTWFPVIPEGDIVPSPRHSHSAVVYQDKMYIFGGITAAGLLNDLFCFDFATHRWCMINSNGTIPSTRWGHTAVVHGDCMYVFGGYGAQYLNDLYEYHFESSTWRRVVSQGLAPSPRHFHSVVVYKDSMYVVSGFGLSRNHSDIYEFKFGTSTWAKVGQGLKPTRAHTAVVYRHSMFLFGGRDPQAALNDVFEYDFVTKQFGRVDADGGERPAPRHFHSAVVAGGAMWVFGGMAKRNTNDLWMFAFEPIQGGPYGSRHAAGVGQSLAVLVNNPATFPDVTINVCFHDDELGTDETAMFVAHRCILYARSEPLRALLTSGLRECATGCIDVRSVRPRVFLALLRYLYTDEVDVAATSPAPTGATTREADLVELIATADEYLVEGLKERAGRRLARAVAPENVHALMEVAEKYRVASLRAKCKAVLHALRTEEEKEEKEQQRGVRTTDDGHEDSAASNR